MMDTWGRVNLRPAPSLLHADLAKKMDAVTVLFEEWQQDVAMVRRQALQSRTFPDIDAALLVYHQQGEKAKGSCSTDLELPPVRYQEYYYVNRRQSSGRRAIENVCDQCLCTLERHCTVYVNVCKGEVLCLPCITMVMRCQLGEDDQDILEKADRLLRAGWTPSLKEWP